MSSVTRNLLESRNSNGPHFGPVQEERLMLQIYKARLAKVLLSYKDLFYGRREVKKTKVAALYGDLLVVSLRGNQCT